MRKEIYAEKLTIEENGIYIKHPAGLLVLSLAFPRPNMQDALAPCKISLPVVSDNETIDFKKELSFYQDIIGDVASIKADVFVTEHSVALAVVDLFLKHVLGLAVAKLPDISEIAKSFPKANDQVLYIATGKANIQEGLTGRLLIDLVTPSKISAPDESPASFLQVTTNYTSITKKAVGENNGTLELSIS